MVNVLEAAAASVINTVGREHAKLRAGHRQQHRHRRHGDDRSESVDVDQDRASISTAAKRARRTLRYTVTLIETAGGPGDQRVAHRRHPRQHHASPASSRFPSAPPARSRGPPAGTNNNGMITVSGMTVPASGSVTVVFDVTVNAGTAAGQMINNTAIINNPNGAENNPSTLPQEVRRRSCPRRARSFSTCGATYPAIARCSVSARARRTPMKPSRRTPPTPGPFRRRCVRSSPCRRATFPCDSGSRALAARARAMSR